MSATQIVSRFYNEFGWRTENGATEDARAFEDLRDCAAEYVGRCRERVCRYVPPGDTILDMASGPIQYPEYLLYSRDYRKRVCVDLSAAALRSAEQKVGDHGVYLCGNFLTMDLSDNAFDCTVSLHTVYHIDKDDQERAVRKLISVTKPGRPVVIVYSNPRTLVDRVGRIAAVLRRKKVAPAPLYFYEHPLEWWERFRDVAEVVVVPWRSFRSNHQKRLFPNNGLGRKLFRVLFSLEDRFPRFFARHFQYPMIILTKK